MYKLKFISHNISLGYIIVSIFIQKLINSHMDHIFVFISGLNNIPSQKQCKEGRVELAGIHKKMKPLCELDFKRYVVY